jgi:hypothetical protein
MRAIAEIGDQQVRRFLEALTKAAWRVEIKDAPKLRLTDSFSSRYPSIPSDLRSFLSEVAMCANSADTAWFLCEADYNQASDSAFRWDEFERMSLEAAGDDQNLASRIALFWRSHIPFLMSVKNGYAFLALSLADPNRGAVVAGREPEFENVGKICGSFEEFMLMFNAHLDGRSRVAQLADFE